MSELKKLASLLPSSVARSRLLFDIIPVVSAGASTFGRSNYYSVFGTLIVDIKNLLKAIFRRLSLVARGTNHETRCKQW